MDIEELIADAQYRIGQMVDVVLNFVVGILIRFFPQLDSPPKEPTQPTCIWDEEDSIWDYIDPEY